MNEIIRELTSGKKFKLTITSDHSMRIKVPESASNEDLHLWNTKCLKISNLLLNEDIQFTLRGHTKNIQYEKFTLHSEHSKKIKITRYQSNSNKIEWKKS